MPSETRDAVDAHEDSKPAGHRSPDVASSAEQASPLEQAMPELYFATVKAIGTDIKPAIHVLDASLGNAGYHTADIHLSELFARLPLAQQFLKTNGTDSEHEVRHGLMDAGDAVRTILDPAGMAKLGLDDICGKREEKYRAARSLGRRGVAFIIRSLMHESEVSFLRAVLGPKLFIISMFSHEDVRRERLILDLGSRPGTTNPGRKQLGDWAEDLMRRDQGREFLYEHPLEGKYGEVIRLSIEKTFYEGDFFVDLDRQPAASAELKRFVELIFSYPYATAREDETALGHAFVAMRESAAMARRVGAAITVGGTLVVTGRNDLPEAGGGQIRLAPEDDPSSVISAEPEASNEERKDVFRDVLRRLLLSEKWHELLKNHGLEYERKGLDREHKLTRKKAEEIARAASDLTAVSESRIFDLIEFNPTVHAEMSAITAAARSGRAIDKGVLYTTTFPCHECTRHIVASGIRRVVYLEPYAKSRAESLFARQIRVGERSGQLDKDDNRVLYEPFMGVAPRRQPGLFSWVPRGRSREAIQSWTLDSSKEVRPSVDPAVPDELRVLRDSARQEEQLAAVAAFWRKANSRATERPAAEPV